MEPVFALPQDITQILIWVAVLAVVWILIRFVFRLATRVMTIGCFAILIIGAILIATRLFR